MKTEYKIDPAHSSAQFTVRHMMITNVRGSFSGIEGSVVYDPNDLKAWVLKVEIDASSINTLDPQRDSHLKSADFLAVDLYPKITFNSTNAEAIGGGAFSITGDLMIHGITKEVVLQVDEPSTEGKDPWGNMRMGTSATTNIKRSDFGLAWNQALETGGLLLGDDLKLAIDVSLIRL